MMIKKAIPGRAEKKQQDEETTEAKLVLHLTRRFVVVTVFAASLVAYSVGRFARIQLLNLADANVSYHDSCIESTMKPQIAGLILPLDPVLNLPDPAMKPGKRIPRTTYTSKNFDTASATTHSRWVVTTEGEKQCASLPGHPACTPAPAVSVPSNNEPFFAEESLLDEEHLPSGQHLLIDIENVDPVFLNSEERLATAMLELVEECGLTLLSYHCHQLKPSGVSCAGVLLESHVSFHTWPSNGVITLDLYTCGPNSLLPVVPMVEKLFAIVSSKLSDLTQMPKMIWAHKYRGFGSHADSAEITDMFHFPVGQMSDFKKEVVSATTNFQRMDVYDVLRPGVQSMDLYKRSLEDDNSYESTHKDYFAPDRIVFLDGVLQSRRTGDAAYHESLVHPAMFAHTNPKRVAIVGGGEGATLREVLKHNTVEKVVMIDIDEQMVQLSREFLPFWSDCSTLVNSTNSCFNDPRVETYYEDAFQWFIDRFSAKKSSDQYNPAHPLELPFDVIIMDALDPQVQKEFADTLYEGGAPIFNQGLAEAGILVAQVGEACSITSPSDEFSVDKNRLKFIEMLVDIGFESVRDYEESHNGFERPWEFIVAFKEFSTKSDWFATSAEIDLKMTKRGMRTKSGNSPFLFFDGPTMESYQYPSKGSEVTFCRHAPNATDCINNHGFDPERINLPLSSLSVRQSSLGETAGRGVFAEIDIPHLSYVGLDRLVPNIHMSTSTVSLISSWEGNAPLLYEYYGGEDLQIYMHGYGHYYSPHGDVEVKVDSTFHCFINHGCNGTNNVGHDLTVTESTANPWTIPLELAKRHVGKEAAYNPAQERQIHYYSSAVPLRNIQQGEELFDNYLGMSGLDLASWTEDVLGLKSQCQGGVGDITEYEVWEKADL